MLRIETHQSALRAEVSRQAFIAAQRIVDSVWEFIHGTPVTPSPEDTYVVFNEEGEWIVAVIDPSIPDFAEERSTDERTYDCGD